ncbi:hypothetical protein B0T22DRAFT_378775 [Podospora appendiculata]|uniref:N-acetyltransferase domain-containing protein n=1 Tax=Podospora appendiculata TaxID=314037 RepID=A0AAE0XA05_9PEZI|nr:hypothetical protein B0T22DRAFT_378775 [Podospora appendiculata]
MAERTEFRIRTATVADAQSIVDAFDSTLPYLASIGSEGQWGLVPFSERPGFLDDMAKSLEQARVWQETHEGDSNIIFAAEVVGPASTEATVPAGFAQIHEDKFSEYLYKQANIQAVDLTKLSNFVFLEVLLVHFGTGYHKGAGTALVQHVKRYGLEKGKDAVYVDCWSGNNRQLVGYYERQGFVTVEDFAFPRENKTPWIGTLLRMDLTKA